MRFVVDESCGTEVTEILQSAKKVGKTFLYKVEEWLGKQNSMVWETLVFVTVVQGWLTVFTDSSLRF